jgi:hypothetical protein
MRLSSATYEAVRACPSGRAESWWSAAYCAWREAGPLVCDASMPIVRMKALACTGGALMRELQTG